MKSIFRLLLDKYSDMKALEGRMHRNVSVLEACTSYISAKGTLEYNFCVQSCVYCTCTRRLNVRIVRAQKGQHLCLNLLKVAF